jgi:hypothetical protein
VGKFVLINKKHRLGLPVAGLETQAKFGCCLYGFLMSCALAFPQALLVDVGELRFAQRKSFLLED